MMNFEQDFFDRPIGETLFYSPKIEIKPVHLANGLFRAVCGKYTNDHQLHQALYATKEADVVVEERVRTTLRSLLAVDGAVFSKPNFSSYTLSHINHITSDNHDRRTGEWLWAILAHDDGDGPSPALELLRSLLMEDEQYLGDELSILTLPLMRLGAAELKNFRPHLTEQPTGSLEVNEAGAFCDPLLYSIRSGFDRLAAHARATRKHGGKLETLRRMVTWGCFSVYLHLANVGRVQGNQRLPMVLCSIDSPSYTLQEASVQSYQWVSRSIDKFLRENVMTAVDRMAATGQYGSLETTVEMRQRIETMVWKSIDGRMQQDRERKATYTSQCLSFFDSYLADTASQHPRMAFANALTDMLDHVLSSSPADIARALGVRIGLLTTSRQRTKKLYSPGPDLLETFICASVPPGAQWIITELADYWAAHYGLLVGVLGTENSILNAWGISPIDGSSLRSNVDALAEILEMSGYAQRHSDGLVFISTD